jgi:hypothetical protein
MASENRDWGYDRIAVALGNLGYEISDQTVGNVLRRHGLLPAPQRKRTTSWTDFIRTHVELLAGTDFYTAEVLTLRGFEPSNSRATSLRYQPRIVSGRAMVATSARTLRPGR